MLLLFLYLSHCSLSFFFFFFNDPATTEIYTLSLHDALPISVNRESSAGDAFTHFAQLLNDAPRGCFGNIARDRKSTRLNSSHQIISYAVFCLKKKKNKKIVLTLEKKQTTITQKKNLNTNTQQ